MSDDFMPMVALKKVSREARDLRSMLNLAERRRDDALAERDRYREALECWTPRVAHDSWGGGDVREVRCGECAPCQVYDLWAALDGDDQ